MTANPTELVARAIAQAEAKRKYGIDRGAEEAWEAGTDYARSEWLADAEAAIAAREAAPPVTPEGQVTEALQGVVEAWEALPGNRHYGVREVQEWMSGDMKPAIDAARFALANRPVAPEPHAGVSEEEIDRAVRYASYQDYETVYASRELQMIYIGVKAGLALAEQRASVAPVQDDEP
jgi:hypothetical protein